jgi:photosystem II stability/assembly factor-like uncharacterized protein
VPLSYVKQAILFPRLICLASICLFLNSPAHALETVFITGYTTTSGSDTDSVVLKSIDNGLNWTLEGSLLRLRETTSVTALSSTNYFAVGGSAGVSPAGYTFSTSGGARTVPSGLLKSVDAASGTYYTAGATADDSSGTILKSTDGTTWTTQVSSGPKLNGISVSDSSVAYAVGASGTILKTDGGTIWSPQTIDSSDSGDYVLYGVDAVNSTTAYAVGKSGSDGVILKTTNGTSWTTTETVLGLPLNAVSVTPDDPKVAFAVGDGSTIMKTIDGSTWLNSGFSTFGGGALSSIYAVSSTKAYAVGVIGSVARLNGGSWVDISSTIPAEYQNYNFTGVSVFTAIPIPEPSTIILSIVAVSVLAIIQRTRRNAPNHA